MEWTPKERRGVLNSRLLFVRPVAELAYLTDGAHTNRTLREILDELTIQMAANFGHAFRRWTKRAPNDLGRRQAA